MKRLTFTLATLLVLIVGTVIAIRYAQGYRLSRTTIVKGTGLLSANSFPNGASVYINGNLTSATDTTLNLAPGEYDIEIKKEGFFPWKKHVKLESELVTQTNALLFPTAPGLSPITFIGASNVHPSPDGQRILFTTASASATRNGLYVMDLSENPLALQKGPHLIAQTTNTIDLNKAQFLWSPDSDQILVSSGLHNYLLDAGRQTDLETAKDMTISLKDTLTVWTKLLNQKLETQLVRFPIKVQRIATASATNIFVSPDQNRLLYTATADAVLAANLVPPVPASDSQPEERHLHPGNTYVYDRREDRNFLVKSNSSLPSPSPTSIPEKSTHVAPAKKSASDSATQISDGLSLSTTITMFQKIYSGLYTNSLQWLPDSAHLIFLDEASIRISEYDGTNMTQVYAGPLAQNFVYPWPNGSKLLILTNFNQEASVPLNLYAVTLR